MNTLQNNSAQQSTEQTETTYTNRFGAPATSTALSTLFEAAADNLTQGELEYLARMDEHAALQAQSLASSLMMLGCFYASAEVLSEPSANDNAEIFWSLSHQLDHIRGLIELAGSAAYQLANPKTEANNKAGA